MMLTNTQLQSTSFKSQRLTLWIYVQQSLDILHYCVITSLVCAGLSGILGSTECTDTSTVLPM